ncbi:MAG: malto-oligosyltrehalose synthase [Pirellulales bacterium]
MNETPTPLATYRVQLHAAFTFDDAATIVPYLAELGISHLYCSPFLQAQTGSTHGYDVVDHTRVNEELGGEEGWRRLSETLRYHGMGQVLDIVPNHMSIADRRNRWWWDVLENGAASRYASYFDVDWDADGKNANVILLPILEDHYGRVLEAGLFSVTFGAGNFELRYRDHVVPLSPRSMAGLVQHAAVRCRSDELAFLADNLGRLPLSTVVDPRESARRHRDKQVLQQLLATLCRREPAIAAALDAAVAETNADHDALDALLNRQNYRLAFWRTATEELDFRRFFDISTLASLRAEDEQVFADTHALVLRGMEERGVEGLRVDHPDGLRDPLQYFERLRSAAPQAWIVAEKILEPSERLPTNWPVAGTTGYDFIFLVDQLLLDPAGEQALTEGYAAITAQPINFHATRREKKHLVLDKLFPAETQRLVSLLSTVGAGNRRFRDYTRRDLRGAVRELIACFPVYRTYVRAEAGELSDQDVSCVESAIEVAKQNRPDMDADLFDFLRDLLLLRVRGDLESEFVMRFQQCSGPIMAKGIEDTAFYTFNRLTSLNEVGGDPGHFGITLDEFHETCAERSIHWPRAMLASTTHDTKRSEDVRARIHLLAEIPDQWLKTAQEWRTWNVRHRPKAFDDPNLEYLIYQTLVGAWPIEPDRMLSYVEKAAREAKVHTSWMDPDQEYEDALRAFVSDLLADEEFCRQVDSFVAPLIEPGRVNSLAATLLKLTAPGVPDIYQGTELWNLSLVDPDNRRAVDYDQRRRLLAEMASLSPQRILKRSDEGMSKLWVIKQTLALRRERPETFTSGDYVPLIARGKRAQHVVAFVRGNFAITVVPRWPLRLRGEWGDTRLELPEGNWVNRFTGERVEGTLSLTELLHNFPVALLQRDDAL